MNIKTLLLFDNILLDFEMFKLSVRLNHLSDFYEIYTYKEGGYMEHIYQF